MKARNLLMSVGAGLIITGVMAMGRISKQIDSRHYAVQEIKREILEDSRDEIEAYRKAQYDFSKAERKLDETETKNLALMLVNPSLVPKDTISELHSNVNNYLSAKSKYETLKASTNRIAQEFAISEIERREGVVSQGLESGLNQNFMYVCLGSSLFLFGFFKKYNKNQTPTP